MTYDHFTLFIMMFLVLGQVLYVIRLAIKSEKLLREIFDILERINNKVETVE